MANSEISLNDKIAAALREINTDWAVYDRVSSESTDALLGSKALRPDILIVEPGAPPVCLETEFQPGLTVESDAKARLGQVVAKSGGKIQAAFAVRIPDRFKTIPASKLLPEIKNAQDFEYCVLSDPSAMSHLRWPEKGYVRGSLADLYVAIQGAATPQSTIEKGADVLEYGASEIAAILDSITVSHPGVTKKVADALKQEPNLQTFRMGATILVNAFVFQENLAGRSDGLESVRNLAEMISDGETKKNDVLAEWNKILKINYWPIFGVAKSILQVIPADIASGILARMHSTASALLELNLGKSSDLSGVIFQRLISDRRFLATFYTTPASAALLNGLVFRDDFAPNGEKWTAPSITQMRIADFACGTGALLCGAYNEVRRHLEINGASARTLHSEFIENCLIGCDVMPSATHITASMLSSAFPEKRYKQTKILTLPFGRQTDGSVNLGAIELLATQGALSIIPTGATGVGAAGDSVENPWISLGGTVVEDGSFDLVVMNPPFTRLTGGGGKASDVPLPMFAAFGTEKEAQELMSKRAMHLTKGTVARGNAGEASIFVQISHNKVKPSGYIALVLPLTFLSGSSWEECRELIRRNYSKILIVTIASSKSGSFAFSADTGVGEVLLVAQRNHAKGAPATRISSVSLVAKPTVPFEGTEIARIVRQKIDQNAIVSLEDGPIGGTPVELGSVRVGEAITGPLQKNDQWPLFRIADHTVAQVAHQLTTMRKLWLPGMAKKAVTEIKLCSWGEIGEIGPYHLDVRGPELSGGAPRGPFELKEIPAGHVPTYPALHSHSAERERTLEILPDSEGIVRVGKTPEQKSILEERRERIWATRSRLHVNTDFRFNSQSLAACVTPEPSLGGRAWPSFKMHSSVHDFVACLWANFSLGLLSYWWIANKAQDGRGSITTTQIPKLVTIDPRTLSSSQLTQVESFFEEMKSKPLLTAHRIDEDDNRVVIDEFVLQTLLGVGKSLTDLMTMLKVVRQKLAMEPSFNGGK